MEAVKEGAEPLDIFVGKAGPSGMNVRSPGVVVTVSGTVGSGNVGRINFKGMFVFSRDSVCPA
jgi:hypothetical protein